MPICQLNKSLKLIMPINYANIEIESFIYKHIVS